MFGVRIIVEAGDPVAVEFMHGGIDPVAFQPAIAQRAGIAEFRRGRPFREPSVFAQQRFENFSSVRDSARDSGTGGRLM